MASTQTPKVASCKTYVHIIPNLGNGGAENFLLRLIPFLHGTHYVVTFLNDSSSHSKLSALQSVQHISLQRFQNIPLLLRLFRSLRNSDRIFSWLHLSDLIASFFAIVTSKNHILVWNIRNTLITTSSYSYPTKISLYINIFFSYIIPFKIVFNSLTALEQFKGIGYDKRKLICIPNGYNLPEKPLTGTGYVYKPELHICCVARYHPQKNHALLFRILSELPESIHFILHLVGPGISIDNLPLKESLDKYNLISKVSLYNELDQSEVFRLLHRMDVSILASTTGESFPNFLAESMVCGCYPICFDVGDSKSIVSQYGKCFPINTSPITVASFIEELDSYRTSNFQSWVADRLLRSSHISTNYSMSKISDLYDLL